MRDMLFDELGIKYDYDYNEYYIDSKSGRLSLYTDETYIFPFLESEKLKSMASFIVSTS